MSEELNIVLEEAATSMSKAINHLEAELVKIRAGKANPNMLDGITADYYGAPTAINQVANVTALGRKDQSQCNHGKKTCYR
jgi:ribosome recycling factor